MAINSKNGAGQTSAANKLNQLMSSQIAYMSANIGTLQTKCRADAFAASNALTAAQDSALRVAGLDMIKATNDQTTAQANVAAAQKEATLLTQQQASLTKEQNAYSAFQQLKSNLVPNKNTINTNLNTFSSTLQ